MEEYREILLEMGFVVLHSFDRMICDVADVSTLPFCHAIRRRADRRG